MDLILEHVPFDPVGARAARLRELLAEMAATGLTGGHVIGPARRQ